MFSYIKKQNHASPIVAFLLSNVGIFKFSPNEISYLNSIKIFLHFHKIIQAKRLRIVKEITREKKTIVKTLYSYIDSRFQLPSERFSEQSILAGISNEEIAEGASYIIEEFNYMFGLSDSTIALSSPNYILNGTVEKILFEAFHIKFIQETEIWIERFGYTCLQVGNDIYISPPSPEFGKAYRLGNILLDMNREGQHIIAPKSLSLYEFVKDFNKQTNNDILYWDEQTARYMLALPISAYLEMYDKKLLLNDGVFHEEKLYLQEVEDLLLIRADKLKQIEFTPGLNFHDLFIVKRVLTFISLAYFDLLEQKKPFDYYNSNIPFLHSNTLRTILVPAIGEEKTNIFLETFSYSNESEDFFDAQYTPLLKGTDHYIVPYNVFTNAHLFRNILFSINNRLFDGTIDPIADKLERVLLEKGYLVKKGLPYKFNTKGSDLDLIAIKGNNIFIFECKNSVLPVNAFELRSVYEQLEKAATKQLPLSKLACNDKGFLKKYDLKIEDENAPVSVYSCIVTTNRLLSGYNINGFPIRNVKQLYDFIQVGEMGFTGIEEDGDSIYSLWEGDKFATEDLINYLKPNTKYYSYMFDSQEEYKQKYEIEPSTTLHFTIYPYNEDSLTENFKKLRFKRKKGISKNTSHV